MQLRLCYTFQKLEDVTFQIMSHECILALQPHCCKLIALALCKCMQMWLKTGKGFKFAFTVVTTFNHTEKYHFHMIVLFFYCVLFTNNSLTQ